MLKNLSTALLACLLFAPGCTFLTRANCGDGILDQVKEACDDGNQTDGDGCDSACQNEAPPQCGDGLINQDIEECDDANTVNGDGCDATCILEFCGDGAVNNNNAEECDDANTNDTDDCTQCKIASCGDGFIQPTNNESCEPPGVGACDANCQLECDDDNDCIAADNGNLCTENERCPTGVCLVDAVLVDDGEDCTTDSCDPAIGPVNDPLPDGSLCDADANAGTRDICLGGATPVCGRSVCGDGFTDNGGGEQCDDGNGDNSDSCPDDANNGGTCQTAFCGDGFLLDADGDGQVDPGDEECDDGNIANGDGCDSTCALEAIPIDCSTQTLNVEVASAPAGSVLSVTNDCVLTASVIINKDITITSAGTPITLTGGNFSFFTITGNSKVILNGININAATTNKDTIAVTDSSLAIINSDIVNSDSANGSTYVSCLGNAQVLIDRSLLHDAHGDTILQATQNCKMIVSNSIFLNATNEVHEQLKIDATANVDILFSTFAKSLATEQGILEITGANSRCRIDSVAASNNGATPVVGNVNTVNANNFGFSFIQNATFQGNTDVDPQFVNVNGSNNNVHLNAGAPPVDHGNPAPDLTQLIFNPLTLFTVDVFDHDKDNRPRTQNQRDAGAFEDF